MFFIFFLGRNPDFESKNCTIFQIAQLLSNVAAVVIFVSVFSSHAFKSRLHILLIYFYVYFFRDTPGIENPTRSWKSTKITNVKFDAHYNETSGRYGFGAGTKPFLIQIDFEAPQDIPNLVGRGVGLLPELARKTSFEKELCNPFLQDPCRKVKAGSRCPAEKGSKFNYVATFPFSGNYYRGLPVDLRVELYATDSPQNTCVNNDNLLDFGEPVVCLILQGYIL